MYVRVNSFGLALFFIFLFVSSWLLYVWLFAIDFLWKRGARRFILIYLMGNRRLYLFLWFFSRLFFPFFDCTHFSRHFFFFLFQSENKPVVQKTYYKNHSHIFSFFLLSFPLKTLPRGGGSIFCGEFNSFLIPELCCYTLLLRTIKKSWYTAAKLS